MQLFAGRTLLIATKHEKELVLAPLFEQALGVRCVVPALLDTDVLGTFSGEIERADDPLVTARKKCVMAMEQTGGDLALASEGSFGPHPTMFFTHADDELLLLLDAKNQLEIVVRFLTTETNFNGMEVKTKTELIAFAKAVHFPSHGLILKKAKFEVEEMKKGIKDWETLMQHFHHLMETYQTAFVETDMRAMHNPMRMEFIGKVAQKLIAKIHSLCPSCELPGFGITAVREGLPCSACGHPTASTLSYVYSCAVCEFTKEERYPHDKKYEEPMFCNVCNP